MYFMVDGKKKLCKEFSENIVIGLSSSLKIVFCNVKNGKKN